MLRVLLKRVRVDDNVVKVCDAELVKVLTEHQIDVALKGRRSVDETERNDGVLVVAIPRTKCHLPLVSGRDPEHMICLSDFQLREIARAGKAIYQLANQRQWITVFLSDLVKTPKVHA